MRCAYCYVPESAKSNREEDEAAEVNLKQFLQKVEVEGYSLGSFCFHGAEPTIFDAKTFAKFCNMVITSKIKTNGTNNYIALQTNGYNLTANYLNTLAKDINPISALRIGFSIDFPKQLHDKYRNNSYDRVVANFKTTLDMGINASVLSVVTSEAMQHKKDWVASVKEMYFLKAKYPNFKKFKIKLATGDYGFKEKDMSELADILIENKWTKLLQILNQGYCLNRGNDCDWYEFAPEGFCFSCNKTFMSRNIFSNWKSQSFDIITKKRANLYKSEYNHPDCNKCEYEMYCNSGCPIDRYTDGKMAGKAHECTIIKKVYAHLQNQGISLIDYIYYT